MLSVAGVEEGRDHGILSFICSVQPVLQFLSCCDTSWCDCAAFCKGSSKKSCGAGGFVCKGHFVGAKVRFASTTALHLLLKAQGGRHPTLTKLITEFKVQALPLQVCCSEHLLVASLGC